MKTLLFIPTYNEKKTIDRVLTDILALGLDLDILFIDDNSPDGTGEALDALAERRQRLRVVHRGGKLGIGSAHQAAIDLAYDEGYARLITMDCDYSHPPEFIPAFLERSEDPGVAVVVGSRYMRPDSLETWSFMRLFLTKLGHFMTTWVLKLPLDATGAFRVYRLDRLPREAFKKVRSSGYSFFFESLFLLYTNGFSIAEVPIVLPDRTEGHSKMTVRDVLTSATTLLKMGWRKYRDPESLLLPDEHRPEKS